MEKSLDNIVTLFSGNAWKAASFKPNGKIPIIRIQNIGDNKSTEFIYWDEEYNENFIVKKGDLLLSLSGSIKLDFWDGQPALLNQRIVKISPKDGIDTHWLFFQLKNYIRKITNMGNHALVNNVSLSDLRKLTLKVPKYPDQLHIANLLSKAENLIAERKESIRLLDEFLKSTFLEMFGDPVRNEKGWEMLSGNDYLSKLTVGVVIKPASYYVSEGVIALRSLNIRPNRIQLDNLVYFSKSVNENELSKSILREGDVVFVRTGMTGTAAIIPKELDGCNCIDLIVTRPKSGVINPQYLVFFFNSDIGKRIVSAKEVGGIQKHFNIGALRKLEIPVPPIELQNQFAHIVEKTEALKTQYQQSLQELKNLYGILSQKAFRGELSISKAVSV